ncbi:uncharacterized protein LOC115336468 isoform X1 [Aquila chrysaetos chrysaetos]|uniref:uncharacterized protein LOC115336468 isoform X1 n=1 Tax=Aquila chrysaetos chrysaetos TaxID=223781 RepID=UPI001176A2CD|nr:uncharacterized protein LOC115336468 isoform X1 [Aquila chrysaetos chrysaetos]XP_029859311.1 uncharacterized protein LOC115336468 isoform X1 [Aquila chrysaetos chrysaetos]XP_040976648.1 uncharacterized protein LOC115336468 isoform X1 [Aquila chrysaetos chrysaetos]XP_040976649.1 uncharacterized protein LOC115336468 isoform X1 [Aquila chrysaetos chrysaetos]
MSCYGDLWKERDFLTLAGKTVAHGQQIKDLLEEIQLPSEISVIYIKAHTQRQDIIAKGNSLAKQATRAAARQIVSVMSLSQHEITFELPNVNKLYEDFPEEEKQQWTQLEAHRREGPWILNNKPLLPKRYLLPITRWQHERTHGGLGNLALRIQRLWAAPGIYTAAKRICEGCKLCRQYASVRIKPHGGKRPPATFPFQKLQTDYADMPKTMGYSYMLVIVDQLSGWLYAFLTRKNDSKAVLKALLKEIIPRYGVPEVTDSDRGSHFTAAILIQIYNSVGIFNKFHTPHHPESSGQVERMNKTLKEKLVKVCKQTSLK